MLQIADFRCVFAGTIHEEHSTLVFIIDIKCLLIINTLFSDVLQLYFCHDKVFVFYTTAVVKEVYV